MIFNRDEKTIDINDLFKNLFNGTVTLNKIMSSCQNTLIGNSSNLISTKANNGDDGIDDIMNEWNNGNTWQ